MSFGECIFQQEIDVEHQDITRRVQGAVFPDMDDPFGNDHDGVPGQREGEITDGDLTRSARDE